VALWLLRVGSRPLAVINPLFPFVGGRLSIRRPFARRVSMGGWPPEECKEIDMRFMVMVKATEDSEAGVMPTEEEFAAMGAFNEELVRAGVMQAGEGLHPSSRGARVAFSGKARRVIDGPFPQTRELVAGFWIWNCASLQEAIEWVKKCPNPMRTDSEIEVRQIFSAEDFGDALTPELRAQEERLRNDVQSRAS
jgi:hypothetical protein